MGVNAYFGTILTNRPHTTHKYGPVNIILKLFIIDGHIVIQKNWLIYKLNCKNQFKN